MKRLAIYNIGLILFLSGVLMGCKAEKEHGWYYDEKAERMIVTGCVTNEEALPLQGIRINISGVREANEKDLLNYNYAITDSAGHYTIIRYMGRQKPDEVTVEAIDPQNIYKSQAIVAQKAEFESLFEQRVEVAVELVANFTLYK